LAEAVCNLDLREAATRVLAPTLILYGERDRATPAEWNIALAKGVPGAATRALPTAHMANAEAQSAFNAAVLEFLAPR
jgi:pimeloyl-ACP methyl ester carboxylesterase